MKKKRAMTAGGGLAMVLPRFVEVAHENQRLLEMYREELLSATTSRVRLKRLNSRIQRNLSVMEEELEKKCSMLLGKPERPANKVRGGRRGPK